MHFFGLSLVELSVNFLVGGGRDAISCYLSPVWTMNDVSRLTWKSGWLVVCAAVVSFRVYFALYSKKVI